MDDTLPLIKTNHLYLINYVSQAASQLLLNSELVGTSLEAIFNIELNNQTSCSFSYRNSRFNISKFPSDDGYTFILEQSIDYGLDESSFILDAIASAQIGIWRFNTKTRQVYLSDIAKQLLNISSSKDITWRKLFKFIHNDDKALFPLFFENHIYFGLPLQFDFRLTNSQNDFWLSLKGCQAAGNTDWINGTVQDCTAEKVSVIALNDADESKQLAIEAAKIGTWRATKYGQQWQWKWDTQANSIFKLAPEDIGNLDRWVELLHPDDKNRVIQALEVSLETGAEFKQNYRSILKNGDVIHVFAQGRVGSNYKGEHCRIDGVCVDQTEIHNTQQALKELNTQLESRVSERTAELHKALQKAEQASKVKSEFLSMISHELRTPLNGIISALDLLAHSQLRGEPLDLVNTASASADHLITILNDLLDLNKIEAGKLELETIPFEISNVINDVVSTFEASARGKHIALEVFECPSFTSAIKGDENRFRQVLFNIISNAIKFTNCSSIDEKRITISTSYSAINDFQIEALVSVTDTGIGMSQATLNKLFTPFTQAEKSTTRRFGGTGLGLSICGKLIDLMAGKITASSQLGKGSHFEVSVPFWLESNIPTSKKQDLIHCFIAGQLSHKNAHILALLETSYNVVIVELDTKLSIQEQASELEVLLTTDHEAFNKYNQVFCVLENPIIFADSIEYISTQFPHIAIYQNQPMSRCHLQQLIVNHHQDNLDLNDFEFTDEENEPTPLAQVNLEQHDILLVEDNPFNQKLIKNQLSKLGLQCDVANNGAEGFACWSKHPYRLILTDCHMPEVDGYEMTKRIRKEETKQDLLPIPIIAVTGAVMQGEKDLCTSIGMNDFLSKPIKLAEIKNMMERWYEQTT